MKKVLWMLGLISIPVFSTVKDADDYLCKKVPGYSQARDSHIRSCAKKVIAIRGLGFILPIFLFSSPKTSSIFSNFPTDSAGTNFKIVLSAFVISAYLWSDIILGNDSKKFYQTFFKDAQFKRSFIEKLEQKLAVEESLLGVIKDSFVQALLSQIEIINVFSEKTINMRNTLHAFLLERFNSASGLNN